ncbi:MAG: cardiolipin synthase [Clostridiales bacterium]|nr:cardiolipin synthase [Clostridiales bacterium]
MKKLFKLFTNKIVLTALFFLIQVAMQVLLLLYLSSFSVWIYFGFSVLSVIVCLFIMGKDANPGYKLAWVVPILIVPLFGGMLYISFGRSARLRRKDRKYLETIENETAMKITEMPTALSPTAARLATLLYNATGYAPVGDSEVEYYPIGEHFFEALKEALLGATRFIFMEYFIVGRGKCWDELVEILRVKAAEGVDVRLIYDDIGCLFTLPYRYHKKLQAMGIKTHVFNKLKPTFNARMNNRTHRKITVVDGKVAFTGGLNLADEYMNVVDRFGYWKDTAVKITGMGVDNFTRMFLRFWMLLEKEHEPIEPYLCAQPIPAQGFVQPIAAGPGKNEQGIEKGMMDMVNNAKSYIYINTPYLILDNEFLTSLCLAAESGIDVRITMPHVPDKKLVFIVSRSFYPILLKAGVKIYEYLPGFLHAKSAVCDDSIAYVGTCNLDYRSFYLHYECGAFLYDVPAISDVKADYLKTLEVCKAVTYEEATDVTAATKLARSVLRLFAPLM